jgi:GH25 family lysozyme M1 (1,4-beta-N-acetylmuramidase)
MTTNTAEAPDGATPLTQPALGVPALGAATRATLPGVDVASFQGAPAAWRAEAGNISWAAVKFTELSAAGPYVDPDAAADWAWLRGAGKGRLGYMFAHPDVSAARTAALFIREAGTLGMDDGDAIALDLEVTGGRTPAEVAAWAADVLGLLEQEFSRQPVCYTFLNFAEAGNCAGLGHFPLWISDPSSPAGHPRVPAPWKTFALHQYSTAGTLDRDVAAFPTLAAMRAALGRKGTTMAYLTDGKKNLRDIAHAHGAVSSEVLRMTAVADLKYPANVADWLNRVFAGQVAATAPVPTGLTLRVPAS